MPRIVNGLDDVYHDMGNDTYDMNLIGNPSAELKTECSWLSSVNSFQGKLAINTTWVGGSDDISDWEVAIIRINDLTGIESISFETSMDSGNTFPFVDTLSPSAMIRIPIAGQWGRVRLIANGFVNTSRIYQLAVIYKRTLSGSGGTGGGAVCNTNTHFDIQGATTQGLNVRVINDWKDDWLRGLTEGRTTGFIAGYCDSVDTNFQSLTNISSGMLPHPPITGVTNLRIASSSVLDTFGITGTGVGMYFIAMMNTSFDLFFEIAIMNGTTPVNIGASSGLPVYRILAAFVVAGGGNYSNAVVNSNKGIIYIGTGAFSTASGFATNYGVNRIGDGTLVVPTYTVPRGKQAVLFQLKYGADGTNPVVYRTFGKDTATGPWQLIIEDVATTTIQPERSLAGGFKPAGAEWHVMAKRRGGANAIANVIAAVYEIDERLVKLAAGLVQY